MPGCPSHYAVTFHHQRLWHHQSRGTACNEGIPYFLGNENTHIPNPPPCLALWNWRRRRSIDGKGGVRFARHPRADWTHGVCSLLPHPRGVPPNIRVLLAAHLECALQAYPLQRGGRQPNRDRKEETGQQGALPVVTNSQILLEMVKIPQTLHTCSFSKVVCQNCLQLHANHSVLLNRARKISPAVSGLPALCPSPPFPL